MENGDSPGAARGLKHDLTNLCGHRPWLRVANPRGAAGAGHRESDQEPDPVDRPVNCPEIPTAGHWLRRRCRFAVGPWQAGCPCRLRSPSHPGLARSWKSRRARVRSRRRRACGTGRTSSLLGGSLITVALALGCDRGGCLLEGVLAVDRGIPPHGVQPHAGSRRGQAAIIVLDRASDIAQQERRVPQSIVDLCPQRRAGPFTGLFVALAGLFIVLQPEEGRGGIVVGDRLTGCGTIADSKSDSASAYCSDR